MKRKLQREAVYEVLALRRLQWDNLIWQVPALSLTGQAFLFSIALGPDSSTLARLISSGLAFILSTASVFLIAKHRQAEITDSNWLQELEQNMPDEYKIHGAHWAVRRNATTVAVAGLNWLPLPRGFLTWVIVLALFALAALGMFVVSLIWPEVFVPAAHPVGPDFEPTPLPSPKG